jgi:hypothetical protein
MSIEVAFREFSLAVIVGYNCTDQVAWAYMKIYFLFKNVTFSFPEIIPVSEIRNYLEEKLTILWKRLS